MPLTVREAHKGRRPSRACGCGAAERRSRRCPKMLGFCAGDDVFFNAFSGAAARGAGVVVVPEVPGSEAWQHAESHWLNPALAQLRSGGISRLDLSAGARCFSVAARARLRFWRRPKPWWEFFG
jgi:hypothetical protein